MRENHLITILKNMKKFNFRPKPIILSCATLLIFAVALILFLSLRPKTKTTPYRTTGFFFDTVIEISIYDSIPENDARNILSDCISLCQKYENLYSRTVENSDIYRINHSEGKEVLVDPETVALLDCAIEKAAISDGITDPTVGALTSLWNITSDDFSLPSSSEIFKALSTIDYRNIILNREKNTVILTDPETKIDLGFIAKGYIADKIKIYLKENEIKSALINLGGNILVIGAKPDGEDFKIGIKNPDNPEGSPITSVSIKDQSVVSSGSYERYVKVNGETYHHILSTKNGYPAESDLSGVTIISDKSVDGDALSTLLFILGKDKAIKFMNENYPEIKAILITKDLKIISVNQ